ncbi:MAG TPA: DUF6370 family protein [Opitutaceae bacterium]|nr:DUF6370 family protein [Opitutaceae bacterium]
MKILRSLGLLTALLFVSSAVFAADKEVTLVGTGVCAKCSLHKTGECQNAVVVKQNGKDEVYLLTANTVSDDFHDNLCKGDKPVKVTGVVKETKDGKEITASKIELVKS